ncbi:Glutaminyl-peptide cyclotransferase [Vitis vinifera]|uniref:Glutaminyl-peptide cyclotransferase n=1 Tax=Vitis vinifera TaxID=29760 RepID=A0A438E2J6_VITVI|nr:Glutaminyl-peptide cyclotransferase [Vitis vinifera]
MFAVLQPDFAVDFTVLQFFYAVDFGLCLADFSQFCSLIPKYLTFDLFLSLPILILIISVISSESGSSYWEGRDQPLSWFSMLSLLVEALQKMDDSYFGEGLTLLGERSKFTVDSNILILCVFCRLFQVTWLKKTGFIYDRNDLSKFETFTNHMRDGWGLATNGEVLFGSDGTSILYQIDPQSMKVIGEHVVKYKGHEVHNLNELEFVDGEIWANVWQTDCIARISHEDGTVRGWILLNNLREGLLAAGRRDIDVLNGIAWDSEKNRLFVTGKLWPKLYEIKVHPMKRRFQDGVIEQLCLRMPFFT